MNKAMSTKGMRLAVLTLALLAALAATQAFSADPAKAGLCLPCAGIGGAVPKEPYPIIWTGTEAAEFVYGSDYGDTLDARGGNDYLVGHGGPDKLYGGAGDDTVKAGFGNDSILPGDGSDTVHAQDGDDSIGVSADGQKDVIDGGSGFDTLRYSPECGGVHDEFQNIEVATRVGSC